MAGPSRDRAGRLDVRRLRVAVGDERLTYWGMSYGTRIGYVYALSFPEPVRAIVLDGSIDPASTLLSLSEGGAAPDQAYGSFADAYPTAAAQLREVQAVLDTRTVALSGGQDLDRWALADLVYSNVTPQSAYATVATVIGLAHAAVLGSGVEQQTAATALSAYVGYQRQSPNSNAGGALRLTPDPVPLITGSGPAVPVLILDATRDGSTIVQWTARMSRALPASRTVTYAGGQHVTWLLAGSSCVNRVADAYVLTTRLPARDRGCPNAVTPPG